MRYKLSLCYKGTNYHGWQRQPNAISVQQVLEDSINLIFRDKIDIVDAVELILEFMLDFMLHTLIRKIFIMRNL
jgi:hypothetical protein